MLMYLVLCRSYYFKNHCAYGEACKTFIALGTHTNFCMEVH